MVRSHTNIITNFCGSDIYNFPFTISYKIYKKISVSIKNKHMYVQVLFFFCFYGHSKYIVYISDNNNNKTTKRLYFDTFRYHDSCDNVDLFDNNVFLFVVCCTRDYHYRHFNILSIYLYTIYVYINVMCSQYK